MDRHDKSVKVNDFQLDHGDDELGLDARKSKPSDRNDMARMGKAQEMKVRTMPALASASALLRALTPTA